MSLTVEFANGRLEKEYEAAFHHFKPDKHLRWLQELGSANVTVELEDRSVTADVSPLQVAIVELFEKGAVWKEEEVAKALGIEVGAVKSAMGLWLELGVLKCEDGVCRLLEVAEEVQKGEWWDWVG